MLIGRRLRLLAAIALAGCSGSTCGGVAGCAAITPFAPGVNFPNDQKISYGAQMRITRAGFDFIEQNINHVIAGFAGGSGDMFVPCHLQPGMQIFGQQLDFAVGDQDFSRGCQTGEGFYVHVDVVPGSLHVDTINPNVLRMSLRMDIATSSLASHPEQGGIGITSTKDICVHAAFPPSVGKWSCIANYNTGSKPLQLSADVVLAVDSKQDPIHPQVSFEVPADAIRPINTDPASLIAPFKIAQNDCSGNIIGACDDVQFISGIAQPLVNILRPLIQRQLQKMIDDQSCVPCAADNNNTCYGGTGWSASCNTGRGTSGICEYENSSGAGPGGSCVSKILGTQGHMAIGSTLGVLGVDPDATMDIYLAAGGAQSPVESANQNNADCAVNGTWSSNDCPRVPEQALALGLIGGTHFVPSDAAGDPSPCVPARHWTVPTQIPQEINFTAEYPNLPDIARPADASKILLGLGISEPFVNKLFFDVYSSGGLCLNLSSSFSSFLSTGLFKTFLPSLGELTHGQDAPMLIAFRPKEEPRVRIGRNTTKNDPKLGKIPDDPVVTISMPDVHLDFYAFIEDRYVRLFTLRTSLDLPLSLEIDPTTRSAVQPVLGQLGAVLTNVAASNSEMLAEDPNVVKDLIGLAINLAQPLLANVLGKMPLPAMMGMRMQLLALNGVVPKTNLSDGYEQLALFAGLCVPGGSASDPATCPGTGNARYMVRTEASLDSVNVPAKDRLLAGELPAVKLKVHAVSARAATPQYSVRVDGGLWQMFRRAEDGVLTIADPLFLLQGLHRVEVRARDEDLDASADSAPVLIEPLIDWEAPQVRLVFDRASQSVRTVAKDNVTADGNLQFAYRVVAADGLDAGWSAYGAAQNFALASLGDDGAVQVRVHDQAGNVAEASFGASSALSNANGVAAKGASHATGCASGAAGWSGFLIAAALLAFRRRR